MRIIKTRNELAQIQETVSKLALVPTMGALHAGHLSLVKIAKENADQTMVSIFVNPLQFGEGEDLDKYPRTLEEDCKKLEAEGVDFVFAPNAAEMYPEKPKTIKANPEIANRLCGLSRPGHFDGVCTVVKLLFDLIKPDSAVFGEKDYQQLEVIKSMVEEYKIPVEIIPAPIMREASGLAMSSRNQYIGETEKNLAANIYAELLKIKNSETSIETAKVTLQKLGIKVEYLEHHWDRLLFAGNVSSTRLIDNIDYALVKIS